MTDAIPLVLIEITQHSRLRVLRHAGVMVAFVDQRADPIVTILPERHQPLEIDAVIHGLPIVTQRHDDVAKSAEENVRRLDEGKVVVAELVR